jgi:two-component system CheB/CheR fusion protein
MAKEGLMLPLRAALNKARKENKVVRRENMTVPQGGQGRVNLEVIPLKNLKDRHYLVFFQPGGTDGKTGSEFKERKQMRPDAGGGNGKEARLPMTDLERELAEARDYLQSVQEQYDAGNEELQASNEEIISANEELQSVNEELETAKEELEASNEELTTVNEEMSHRNVELGLLNSDLRVSLKVVGLSRYCSPPFPPALHLDSPTTFKGRLR